MNFGSMFGGGSLGGMQNFGGTPTGGGAGINIGGQEVQGPLGPNNAFYMNSPY